MDAHATSDSRQTSRRVAVDLPQVPVHTFHPLRPWVELLVQVIPGRVLLNVIEEFSLPGVSADAMLCA